ncbi:hypothetical protein E5D57_013260 [Metarhizium anisopliae]|nr:hypothetical protein E5D57_013260 [Metarhizium anisopliae]
MPDRWKYEKRDPAAVSPPQSRLSPTRECAFYLSDSQWCGKEGIVLVKIHQTQDPARQIPEAPG